MAEKQEPKFGVLVAGRDEIVRLHSTHADGTEAKKAASGQAATGRAVVLVPLHQPIEESDGKGG